MLPHFKGFLVTTHILVIDDQEQLLSLLRMVLEDERTSDEQMYQVSVLQQGCGAVEHIQANPPDLVVLDLKLGDADGLDILKGLRARASTADIPVVVYTAAVMAAEQVERLVSENPSHYVGVSVLQKPFELETLLAHLDDVL